MGEQHVQVLMESSSSSSNNNSLESVCSWLRYTPYQTAVHARCLAWARSPQEHFSLEHNHYHWPQASLSCGNLLPAAPTLGAGRHELATCLQM
jgi:hypothetical protein